MMRTCFRWTLWVELLLWCGNLFAGTVLVYENGGTFSSNVTEGSLTYSDGTTALSVSGDKFLQITNIGFNTVPQVPFDLDNFKAAGLCTSSGTLVGDGVTGSLYFSFLCESIGADISRTAGLVLYDGNRAKGFNQCYVGRVTSANVSYVNYGYKNTTSTGGVPVDFGNIGTGTVVGTNTTHLIVGKVDFSESTKNATLSLWVDPNLTAGMSGQSEDKSTLGITSTSNDNLQKLSFNQIRFVEGSSDLGNSWNYDEVRMGTTWESVLPTNNVAWDGEAGTAEWDTASNWNRGTVPGNGDTVSLGMGAITKSTPLTLTDGALHFSSATNGGGTLSVNGAANLTGTKISVSPDLLSQYAPMSQTLITSTGLTGFTGGESEFWKVAADGGNVTASLNDDYNKVGVLTLSPGTVNLSFADTVLGWSELRNLNPEAIATVEFSGDETKWEPFATVLELAYDGLTVDTTEALTLKLSGFEDVASSGILWDLADYNTLNGTNFAVKGLSATLPAVPEPATWFLLLFGLGMLRLGKRSKSRR